MYFNSVQNDAHLEMLFSMTGDKVEPERTGDIWQWDDEKYKSIAKSSGSR